MSGPGRRCAVPGCGAALGATNWSGVCRAHNHARAYCRCRQCTGVEPQGKPVRAAVRDPVDMDAPLDRAGLRATDPLACRALWAAVLVEGLREHLDDPRVWGGRGWVGSRGFYEVCLMASIDAGRAAEWVRLQEFRPGRHPLRRVYTRGEGADRRVACRTGA